MQPFILVSIYLLASIGVGYLGRRTVIGGLGSFLLSLLLTPLLVFLMVMAFRARPDR